MNRTTRLFGILVAGTILAACSTADADPEPEQPDAQAEEPAGDAAEEPADEPAENDDDGDGEATTVTITGVDYGFDGFPGSLDVGTTLAFENASETEYHEMVVMRINDGEDRSVDELLGLPDEEAMSSMTFVGVAAAAPGETGAVLDGDLTLTEPGRYVATCFIPVGADPAVVEEAFSGAGGDGPPDMGDGQPHAMAGMVAEFTVE